MSYSDITSGDHQSYPHDLLRFEQGPRTALCDAPRMSVWDYEAGGGGGGGGGRCAFWSSFVVQVVQKTVNT